MLHSGVLPAMPPAKSAAAKGRLVRTSPVEKRWRMRRAERSPTRCYRRSPKTRASSDAGTCGARIDDRLAYGSLRASYSSRCAANATDGHRFVGQAIERGAAAVVVEQRADPRRTLSRRSSYRIRAARSRQLADAFYGNPSRDMMRGGRHRNERQDHDAQMIAAILNAAGRAVRTIGTIGARLGEREWPLENTTPLAPQLHDLLAQMREAGAKARRDGSQFARARPAARRRHTLSRGGAFTNLTRDHLDFHKSFDAYAAAKRRLFDMAPRCVFNADDELGARWARELRARKPVLTYGMPPKPTCGPIRLDVRPERQHVCARRPVVSRARAGAFQRRQRAVRDRHRALARHRRRARGARTGAARARPRAHGARSRRRHRRHRRLCAHAGRARERPARAARNRLAARLIVVFGCGGDRDRGKRPQMGAVAARYADFTYVTATIRAPRIRRASSNDILRGHRSGAARRVRPTAARRSTRRSPGAVRRHGAASRARDMKSIRSSARGAAVRDLAVAREALSPSRGARDEIHAGTGGAATGGRVRCANRVSRPGCAS